MAGYKILGWKLFSFRILKLLLQWSLSSITTVENLNTSNYPSYVTSSKFLATWKIFFFSPVFWNNTMIYFDEGPFIYSTMYWVGSFILDTQAINSEKWSWILLLFVSSPPFSLFFFFFSEILLFKNWTSRISPCDMFPWCSYHLLLLLLFFLEDFLNFIFWWFLVSFFLIISNSILWLFQELFLILWFVGIPHSLFHGYIISLISLRILLVGCFWFFSLNRLHSLDSFSS